ncbi:MAG: hypothetical protein LBI60_05780 [Bacteroidales bacterium]|jgi:TRAP-type C4-dicarboxylate transport system permease small subunit|nr:hypothetical protein [Bacteroidales bacterium]
MIIATFLKIAIVITIFISGVIFVWNGYSLVFSEYSMDDEEKISIRKNMKIAGIVYVILHIIAGLFAFYYNLI